MNINTEEEIKSWSEFVNGDKDAFELIYNLNIDALFAYGMKLNPNKDFVKDSIQDVFLDVYEQRKTLSTPRDLKFYLFMVLKRTMFRKLKHERKKGSLAEVNQLSFITEYNIEGRTILREKEAEQKIIVKRLINELTPKQQEILYLRFTKSFSYVEISKIVEIDHNSVRKQTYRAIKKLRQSEIFKNNNDVIKYIVVLFT